MAMEASLMPTMESYPSHPAAYPKAIAVVATVAALYFGRDIFIPLALAILLTFALAPLVSLLRRIRVPRPAAVVVVVIGAFAAIFMFGAVVASQLGTLAQNIPLYQSNLEAKVKVIKDANPGGGVIDRISQMLERLGREIQTEEPRCTGRPGQRRTIHAADYPSRWSRPTSHPCRCCRPSSGR